MIEYRSTDGKFRLNIENKFIQKAIHICLRSNRNETGGIIIGKYDNECNCAVITELFEPSKDSRSGPTWFWRGTAGLQNIINQYWIGKKEYYLGEWHFHPFALPNPSGQDISQMRSIAFSSMYKCPEPILLIVGGNPKDKVLLRVFVFPQGELTELFDNG